MQEPAADLQGEHRLARLTLTGRSADRRRLLFCSSLKSTQTSYVLPSPWRMGAGPG